MGPFCLTIRRFQDIARDYNSPLTTILNGESLSSLNVNKDKTEGMWLGSKINSSEKPLGIKWSKDPKRVLGVYQSYNEEQKNKLNFQPRLRKLKQILNLWKKN